MSSYLHCIAELIGHVPNLLQRISHIAIALEKVKDGLSKNLESETHVTIEVE